MISSRLLAVIIACTSMCSHVIATTHTHTLHTHEQTNPTATTETILFTASAGLMLTSACYLACDKLHESRVTLVGGWIALIASVWLERNNALSLRQQEQKLKIPVCT